MAEDQAVPVVQASEPASAPSAERPVDLDAQIAESQSRETVNASIDRTRDAVGKFVKESAPATEPDASPETVPGETESAEPAQEPSFEPPRSWSKEDKEAFAALPPATQAYIAEREQAREADFLRRQNEVNEKARTLTAKEQAAEIARQQHEQAAAHAVEVLQNAGEFADIKTSADEDRLSTEDPFKYIQWLHHKGKLEKAVNDVRQLQQQRQQEAQQQFTTWASEQDSKFATEHKEFADPKRAAELRDKVVLPYITDVLGIKQDVLPNLWVNPLFRAAEMQRAIYDAARFHAAQKAAKAAAPKAPPPAQRPGTAPAQGGDGTDLASIADLDDMERYAAMRAKAARH